MDAVNPISNIKKFLITSFIFFVSLVLAVVIVAKEYIQVNELDSQVTDVKGLNSSVDVSLDTHSIPEINAQNDQDLYFLMGFLHAQDRLWQMEVQKRLSHGRLSELFGKSAVNQDIWMRTLGLGKWAEKTLIKLPPELLLSLESYSRGVNYWLEQNKNLPTEFDIFDIQPEPWKPVDSLAWIKMFSLNLSGNFRQEIQRLVSMKYLKEEDLNVFFPETSKANTPYSSQASSPSQVSFGKEELAKNAKGPLINLDVALLKTLLAPHEALEANFNVGGKNVGSNAWVVAGKHTATGAPILANDPHLGLQIPSLWYAVKQNTPNMRVSGMSLVGLPLVIFGRNQHIAWGGTNMMADVQDLTIEEVHPTQPNLYKHNGEWVPFTERVETIHIRQDFPASFRTPLEPIEIVVKETVRGPIVNDRAGFEAMPLSLQWVSLTDDDTTYDAFYQLNRAHDWNSFLSAMSLHVAPALNLFYADAQNIGYKGVGRLPLRTQSNGALPADAENGQWVGFVPFSEMPESFNPASGILFNANNRNVNDDYPHVISNDFAHPARAQRIEQMLKNSIAQGEGITLQQMKDMQHDTLDISAGPLVEAMLQVLQPTSMSEPQNQALSILKNWSLKAEKNSVAATIYYTWLFHIKQQLFNDELRGYWNTPADKAYLSGLPALVRPESLAHILTGPSNAWCDNTQSTEVENCQWVLQTSLASALADLESLYGNDMDDWQWGEAQQTLYSHMPFSQMKVLDMVFERRIGTGGAPNAIHASTSTYNDVDGFEVVFGAGFRQVMSIGTNKATTSDSSTAKASVSKKIAEHYLMNSTGQSGQWRSEHYDDMVELFNQNKFIDMNANTAQTIRFIPAAQ